MLLTGAGGGASNVLASVPWVAQWKFNNNGNDSIGANNLTNNNSATFTTGKLGGATGATQLVAASSQQWTHATAIAIGTNVDFTICFWANHPSGTTNSAWVAKWGASPNYAYNLMLISGKIYMALSSTGSNYVELLTGNAVSADTWHCYFGWFDSQAQTMGVQLDDNSPVTQSFPHNTVYLSAEAFRIGRAPDYGLYANGDIDNVCIAKSAAGGGGVLTAAQRTAFYNAGVGTETLS